VTRRFARRLGIAGAVVAGVVVLAAAGVCVQSQRILRKTYDVPLTPVVVPADSASIAEGARLAATRGCPACHGDRLEGRVFFAQRWVARVVAPNLTRAAREQSDAELARVIRHGVRRDGTSVFAMPSGTFAGLTDADLGRLIAYLRSVPPVDGPGYELTVGPLGRLGLVTGKYTPVAPRIELAAVGRPVPREAAAPVARNPKVLGRYIARTVCSECHGGDLQGEHRLRTPSLARAAGYAEADFTALLRTGVATGGRPLGVMGDAARQRFAHLTDDEVVGLYLYLKSLE
jgi:mono/diheme cytochrome c family protein